MKSSLLPRQWLWMIALTALAIVATLPFARDTLRSELGSTEQAMGKVTLTCFDRDMRPHECAVSAPAKVAAK